jgi:AcrR family transcriptional regulator
VRKARYHHGSLREDAIRAALAEVERAGHETFTLDAVARALGVTTPALYRHFRNREDLLAAVVADGFGRFVRDVDAAASSTADPAGVLRATGRAYVRFANENPGWFRLQFSQAGLAAGGRHDEGPPPAYFFLMGNAIAALTGGGDEVVHAAYLLCWAAMHGLAGLTIEGMLGAEPAAKLAAAEAVIEALVTGLQSGVPRAVPADLPPC